MSQNDILFSRGVANATIVASGTKIAVGVVSNPLTVSLATADFQIFGSTGLLIPNSNSSSTTGLDVGIVRFNPDTGRLEVNKAGTWRYLSDEQDIGAQQFESVGAGSHYYTDSYVVIEKGGDANTVSLLSVGLSIQDPEPTIVLRNLSSATGNSAIYMTGGTGNTDPSAVNGFQIKTITGNSSIYDSSLEINPVIQGDLSTTMNSITLTPYGMEIVPAVISITGSGFAQPTLKIRGSAHTTETALTVDKEDIPGVLPASSQTDSNKIASFRYATDSVLDILGSGKLWVNGSSGAVLAVKAITDSGYLAKFEQGTYSGTNLEGLLVELSVSSTSRNLAVFNGYNGGTATKISAARIDSIGNMFVRNNLSVGGILSIAGNVATAGSLSLAGNINITGNLSVVGNASITGNSTVSGTLSSANAAMGNLSVLTNITISGTLSSANAVVENLSVLTKLSVSTFNSSTITAQNITGQSGAFGNLTVTGSTTFGSITYTDLSVAGNLSVGGTVVSNMKLGAGLSVAGNMLSDNNLSVAGRISGTNYPARVFYGIVSRGVSTITLTTFRNTISDTVSTSATTVSGIYVSSLTFTGTSTYGSFSLGSSNTIVQTQAIESTSAGGRCQNVSFSASPNTIDITNVVTSTNGTGAWDWFITVLYFN